MKIDTHFKLIKKKINKKGLVSILLNIIIIH
jgi:hypothetical protein